MHKFCAFLSEKETSRSKSEFNCDLCDFSSNWRNGEEKRKVLEASKDSFGNNSIYFSPWSLKETEVYGNPYLITFYMNQF